MNRAERIDWPAVLKQGAAIVESYDTAVTLRQLFYRLVAAGFIRNTEQGYKGLSRVTAVARRVGGFPQLADAGRTIHRYTSWANPQELLKAAAEQYRRDRTEGQAALIYLIVEKNTLVAQLQSWFGDLGLPILSAARLLVGILRARDRKRCGHVRRRPPCRDAICRRL